MRLLVVEDSDAVRRRIAAMLREIDGVEAVEEAADVQEALGRLAVGPTDLIVLDLHLRGSRGTDTVAAVCSAARGARVAVLTNDAAAVQRRASLALGADYFFDKSLEFDALLALVTHLSRPT